MKQSETKEVPKEPTLLDHARSFQIAFFAAVIGLLGLLAALLLSGSHKKGLTSISSAMQGLGEQLAAAKGAGDTSPPPVDLTRPDEPGAANTPQAVEAGSVSGSPSLENEKIREFVQLLEEKIAVLSKEGNYLFFRYFIDLVHATPLYAAAILLALSDEVAKLLIDKLSLDNMEQIRDFLGTEGGLKQAQGARQAAFQVFYGKIALDEFTDSPLMKIRNIEWLTKINSQKLVELTLSLPPEEQSGFLSCFTPSRLAYMLQAITEPDQKEQLIQAIKGIDTAQVKDYRSLFEKIEKRFKAQEKQISEEVKRIIDPPRFYAQIISELEPGDRAKFLRAIEDKQDLLVSLKKYYMRFEEVRNIEDHILRSLLGKRPAKELAILAFTAPADIQDLIIKAMPEALQVITREELETLKGNEAQKAANAKRSLEMQDEIARALLKMNKEGLVTFKEAGDATKVKLAAVS